MTEKVIEIKIGKMSVRLVNCPTVYFPAEDTMLLLRNVSYGERTLEIGAGSGIVSIYLSLLGSTVDAYDIDPEAVKCVKLNASLNEVNFNIEQGDLFQKVSGKYDVVVFNPPYLPGDEFESFVDGSDQWFGGKDGMAVIRNFLSQLENFLKPSGKAFMIMSSRSDIQKLIAEFPQFLFKELDSDSFFFERIYCFSLELLTQPL